MSFCCGLVEVVKANAGKERWSVDVADLAKDNPFGLFSVGAVDPGRPEAAFPESAVRRA